MTRLSIAAALTLLAAPAHADTFCEYSPSGTNVTIAPHDEHFAQVHIANRLAPQGKNTCNLTLWGVTVKVLYEGQKGDAPDTFYISVPPGFLSIPPQITIDDRDSARVMIVIADGVGM